MSPRQIKLPTRRTTASLKHKDKHPSHTTDCGDGQLTWCSAVKALQLMTTPGETGGNLTHLHKRQAQRFGDNGHQLQDDADDDEVDLAVRRDRHADGDHHLRQLRCHDQSAKMQDEGGGR